MTSPPGAAAMAVWRRPPRLHMDSRAATFRGASYGSYTQD